MTLKQAVENAFKEKELFLKNNVVIKLNTTNETITIPAKYIFEDWCLEFQVTEDNSPKFFKSLKAVMNMFGVKAPKKKDEPIQ